MHDNLRPGRNPFTEADDRVVLQMYADGYLYAAIARKIHKTDTRVSDRIEWFRERGMLPKRRPPRHQRPTNQAKKRDRDANRRLDGGWAKPGTIKMCPVWGFASGLWFAEQEAE